MNRGIARFCAVAGAVLFSVAAYAFYDAQILIQRALNSPTLNIKYSGANAALVELRLNGISLGSRTVSASKSSGEASFTMDLGSLNDGDNEVEIRLFDKSGKLLGTERTLITTDDGTASPVKLMNPKMGATVQGPVEIKVGFGRELRSAYVSFFVNSQFKSMTNSSPFRYVWDTTLEANGWHELEAWIVDESSTTFKTRKVRVLVNNPGGRTERRLPQATPSTAVTKPVPPSPVAPAVHATAGARTPIKTSDVATVASGAATGGTAPLAPATIATGSVSASPGGKQGVRSPSLSGTQASGSRLLTPAASAAKLPIKLDVPTGTAMVGLNSTAGLVRITKGQRLPNVGSFVIVLNSNMLDFDVSPRVQNGVPLTPFRHLIEKAGGEVRWLADHKSIDAIADGKTIYLKIGDRYAKINGSPFELELAPFIENGRTIVPLSFIGDALEVEIEYDAKTGHVLITNVKKG